MLRVLRNLTLSISPMSVALQGSAPPLATPGQFLRLDLVVVTCFQGSSLALPFFPGSSVYISVIALALGLLVSVNGSIFLSLGSRQ